MAQLTCSFVDRTYYYFFWLFDEIRLGQLVGNKAHSCLLLLFVIVNTYYYCYQPRTIGSRRESCPAAADNRFATTTKQIGNRQLVAGRNNINMQDATLGGSHKMAET